MAEAPGAATPATPFPVPAVHLNLNLKMLRAGQKWHRIHSSSYASTTFNPGRGDARFSPIFTTRGQPVPTLYGGSSLECAAMETIFHDVPYVNGTKNLAKATFVDLVYSVITTTRALTLVDLSAKSLRNMGVTRKDLIESDEYQYQHTRRWAEAIHHQCPDAQGLRWVSRQDDTAVAVVLFGDRIRATALRTAADPWPVTVPPVYDRILSLAELIGVNITTI